jgi:hypothetical protein
MRLLSVTQENSTDLASQNPSRIPKAIRPPLKPDVFRLRKHWAEVLLVFCVCELARFYVIFCSLPRSVLFSWVKASTRLHIPEHSKFQERKSLYTLKGITYFITFKCLFYNLLSHMILDHREIWLQGVNWIHLARDKDMWRIAVNAVDQ